MNSRERIQKALNLQKVDKIPLYENFISLGNALEISPGLITDEHRKILKSDSSPSKKNEVKEKLMEKGLERELEVASKAGLDAISIAVHPEVEWITPNRLRTEFGRIYKPNLNLLGYGAVHMLRQEKSEQEAWEESEVESPEGLLQLDLDPEGNDRLEMLKGHAKENVLPIPELLMLQRVWSLFNYEKYMELLTQRKDLFREIIEKWRDYNLKTIDLLNGMGYDVFFYGDDFGSTRGGLYPIQEFRELVLPYLEDIVDGCHRRDSQIILHSCGDINRYIPDLVDAGFDGLHPVEPPWMDFKALKKTWGDRICLLGNVDSRTTLVKGSPEKVREETKEKIKVGGLKGHILSSSHSIHPGVRFKNWMEMLEAAEEFGRRGWVRENPPGELPEWKAYKGPEEKAETWEQFKKQRRRGLISPGDLYVASRRYQEAEKRNSPKIAAGTVATPHEAGRKLVSSYLGVYGFKVTEVGRLTERNCVERLKGYEIALLSCVKNPQAFRQGKKIGERLEERLPELKVVVGGGALNRLLEDMKEEMAAEDGKEKLKEELNADAFCEEETEAVDAVKSVANL